MYTTAAPSVPNMQASGTSRFGFSTPLEFCAADSMPRNAQRVSEMLDVMHCQSVSPFVYHACEKVSELNQNQPMIEIPATGMITPQTVMAPIFPVMLGPPMFATVGSQSRTVHQLP